MNAHQRLLAALDTLEPSVRKEVERALAKLRRRLSEAKIVDALERGDMFLILAVASAQARDLELAVSTLQQAFNVGRVAASGGLPVSLRTSFTMVNPLAVREAGLTAARFVTGVSAETRKAIRTVITHAFTEGIAPRNAARLIRPVIGLTARQAQAVMTRRSDDLARGLSAARAEARANTYAKKLLKQRAEMIARTEIIKASTDGQLAVWKQAKAQGLIPATAQVKWITTPDDRLCPVCEALHGETVPLGGLFQASTGAVVGPPAHPNCRCAVVLDAKSIGVGVKAAAVVLAREVADSAGGPKLLGTTAAEVTTVSKSALDVAFKVAAKTVDGRTVLGDVPNTGSISASLGSDYETLRGIRNFPISAFENSGLPKFVSATEEARTRALAERIKASGDISPLIVVIDAKGPYILEGGHRFDALKILGARSFPALVVVDTSEVTLVTGQVIKPAIAAVTGADVQSISSQIMRASEGKLAVLDLRLLKSGDVQLETIAVAAGNEGLGAGASGMEKLIDWADARGVRLVLNLAEKGYQPVEGGPRTTSSNRLKEFYKRYGFVEPKGRNYDPSLSSPTGLVMYRNPKGNRGR